MERKRLCQRVAWLAVGVSAAWLVNSAAAQETLGRNKSPAQTFASDCAVCHKSPQGLGPRWSVWLNRGPGISFSRPDPLLTYKGQ